MMIMIMIMTTIKIGRRAIIMTAIIKSQKEDESPIFQKFSKVKTASLSLSIISFILKKLNKK